ncbi:MAG: hypothetical protein V4850_17195 [Myxococcota bacterium]
MLLSSWLLLTLVTSCARECGTATCLADAAVADWPADQAGVTGRILALPDDLTRTVVVGRLCEAFPGQTAGLCTSLPDELSRQRCLRLNGRPHLSSMPGPGADEAAPAASGGVPADGGAVRAPAHVNTATLPEDRLPLPTVATTTVAASTCADAPDRSACLDASALDAALSGHVGRADAVCGLHAEPRWADECRFNAAEQSVRTEHAKAYAGAVALCGAATSFTQECLVHVLTRVPKQILPLDAGPERVQGAARDAETIRAAWAVLGADVADRHVDRYWALYFANVYRETRDPDGTPLSWYPEEAWPHVRAAATMRLRELGQLSGPLSAQLSAVEKRLAERQEPRPRRGRPADLVFVEDRGSPASDGPSVYFLGASRRALGADARTDLTFCLLESAGRARPPDVALLEEAAAHPDARVRIEARRIQDALAWAQGAAPG